MRLPWASIAVLAVLVMACIWVAMAANSKAPAAGGAPGSGDAACCPSRAGGPAALDSSSPSPPAAGPQESPPVDARSGLPRLIDLGAKSCIPCKMMAPILDDLRQNYADQFATEFIDVRDNPQAGRTHGILQIPTQIFLDANGRELYRHEGFLSKEAILAKWKELGAEVR